MVCYPAWMVDGQGNILPDRFFRYVGLTKAKPHREVKRRGKRYILSLDVYEIGDQITWQCRGNEPGWFVNENVEEWLNHHLGSGWSCKFSVWFDSELEYDREFVDISFPDMETLTLFKLVWLGNHGA